MFENLHMKRLMHCGKDNPIQSPCLHCRAAGRDGEAERLGGPKINDQIELRGRFEIGCQVCSSSNSTLAAFKSRAPNPSVNQP